LLERVLDASISQQPLFVQVILGQRLEDLRRLRRGG